MANNQNPYGVSPHSEESNSVQQKQFAPEKNNGYAITAMILGILSLFMSILTAIPGIIIGHMAFYKIKHQPDEYDGSGMALTGLILSYLMLIFFLLLAGFLTYMFLYEPGFREEFNREFSRGFYQGTN